MDVVFWLSALMIAYVYVGYPLILAAWVRIRKSANGSHAALAELPAISIVLAARNEAARLPGRLDNLLALDYPPERRQIIVVLDGCDKAALDALDAYRGQVEQLIVPPRGKAAALNQGVAHATGEILVFADARQTFASDALLALAAPFADHRVGGVSGELILGSESARGRRSGRDRRATTVWPLSHPDYRSNGRRGDGASSIGESVGFYWRYEKHLRRLESAVGSVLGATGAIYALRRSLWQPLPEGAILDDVLAPMRAVLSGSRIVFEPRAQAYDSPSRDSRAERRRKIRTLAGNVQILWFEPRLLIPVVNPVWFQYVSHKLGRLLVPYAMVGAFVASAALAPVHPFYLFVLLVQCLFYADAAYGAWLEHSDRNVGTIRHSLGARIARAAFAIVVLNASAVAGLGAALFRRSVWR
jgi:biofilm PGA synthesis N-glycosyltransferase PgaC